MNIEKTVSDIMKDITVEDFEKLTDDQINFGIKFIIDRRINIFPYILNGITNKEVLSIIIASEMNGFDTKYIVDESKNQPDVARAIYNMMKKDASLPEFGKQLGFTHVDFWGIIFNNSYIKYKPEYFRFVSPKYSVKKNTVIVSISRRFPNIMNQKFIDEFLYDDDIAKFIDTFVSFGYNTFDLNIIPNYVNAIREIGESVDEALDSIIDIALERDINFFQRVYPYLMAKRNPSMCSSDTIRAILAILDRTEYFTVNDYLSLNDEQFGLVRLTCEDKEFVQDIHIILDYVKRGYPLAVYSFILFYVKIKKGYTYQDMKIPTEFDIDRIEEAIRCFEDGVPTDIYSNPSLSLNMLRLIRILHNEKYCDDLIRSHLDSIRSLLSITVSTKT